MGEVDGTGLCHLNIMVGCCLGLCFEGFTLFAIDLSVFVLLPLALPYLCGDDWEPVVEAVGRVLEDVIIRLHHIAFNGDISKLLMGRKCRE